MKRQLTYKISKYSTYLKADEVDSEIARAFRVWENVTDFTFVRSDSDDDVEIEIRCCRSTATEMSSFFFFLVEKCMLHSVMLQSEFAY